VRGRGPARTTAAVVVVVGLGLGVAGCGWWDVVDSRAATAGPPTTLQDLQAEHWVLDSEESSVEVAADTPVTLDFGEDDEVWGAGPCNAYWATFRLHDDEHIVIEHLATTLRLCLHDVMQAEELYLAALTAVDTAHVNVEGDELVLSRDDTYYLSYTARPDGD
jgi:heat shock protein HslJ